MLQAQFLAAVQVIVYAGAIVVLFLFVVMLIGGGELNDIRDPNAPVHAAAWAGRASSAVVLGVLLLVGRGLRPGRRASSTPTQGERGRLRHGQRAGHRRRCCTPTTCCRSS